jgi:hypothetical protein
MMGSFVSSPDLAELVEALPFFAGASKKRRKKGLGFDKLSQAGVEA